MNTLIQLLNILELLIKDVLALKDVIDPFLVAALTYFIFGKLDELKKRKEQSRLGASVLLTLEEEVKNGINIMANKERSLLPYKSWQGINTINDNVLIRILEVTKNAKIKGFPASEIRIHTKNYFDHMVENWNEVCTTYQDEAVFKEYVNKTFNSYPAAAQNVLGMLENTRNLLEKNYSKLWPK